MMWVLISHTILWSFEDTWKKEEHLFKYNFEPIITKFDLNFKKTCYAESVWKLNETEPMVTEISILIKKFVLQLLEGELKGD